MPAFYHPNQHSSTIAQLILNDMQPPVQLVYENGDPVDDDDDDDDEPDQDGPPPLEPQEPDDGAPGQVNLPEEPAFNHFNVHHHHHGNHHAAVLAHWFTAQHQNQHGAAAAVLNDLNIDLDFLQPINVNPVVVEDEMDAVEMNLHGIPHMHMFGALPDDLMTLFHATSAQGSLGHGATMRMLKMRILSLRARKPQYWPRIAMGLYKRTSRGATGGCDARMLVKPKNSGAAPGIVWGHKFILASNSVFRQLLSYNTPEDCLADDGKVTDLDVPSITAEAMRMIVMATYDILPPKLSLELAQYLEYWAVRFCLDDLQQLCHKIINTAPWR